MNANCLVATATEQEVRAHPVSKRTGKGKMPSRREQFEANPAVAWSVDSNVEAAALTSVTLHVALKGLQDPLSIIIFRLAAEFNWSLRDVTDLCVVIPRSEVNRRFDEATRLLRVTLR